MKRRKTVNPIMAVLLGAVWFSLGFPTGASVASTFYIAPNGMDSNGGTSESAPFKTFFTAFSAMKGGDELVLLDGTYGSGTGYLNYEGTGSAQPPSGISKTQMTYVHAKNPGSVIINGNLFIGRSTRKDSYIKIEGITFEGSAQLYNTSYLYIKNCGFHSTNQGGGAVFALGTNDGPTNTYDLVEDCWVWGQERIIAINYRADYNVWRRVVVRGDGCGSSSCTTGGAPNVGITVYDSKNVSMQNVIVVDRILGGGNAYADFATAQHGGASFPLGNAEWIGTISLNSQDNGYTFEGTDTTGSMLLKNAVAWNTAWGFNPSSPAFNDLRLENLTAGNSAGGDAFRTYDSPGGYARNLIAYNYGRMGINSITPVSYVDVYSSRSSTPYNTGGVTPTNMKTSNPLSDGSTPSLKYITRIESGSALKGAGYGGADIGANILFRYGIDGAFYGDAGYNMLSSTELWPWLNEARIKKEMCTDAGVTRGFCSAQTLTKYIWEYLGNPIPSEIYGGTPPPAPPAAPANLRIR